MVLQIPSVISLLLTTHVVPEGLALEELAEVSSQITFSLPTHAVPEGHPICSKSPTEDCHVFA